VFHAMRIIVGVGPRHDQYCVNGKALSKDIVASCPGGISIYMVVTVKCWA
jgi:hypothetical protein